ncbi:MAG: single-stranded DNA-binding protein [Bacteroidales bacterium]|nr:single-stranded DNA-binding protein [Bacteroidales bacterium]MBQ6185974.1 single-stranded DNA-binding protein [Bacteroidales bacterium]
MEQLNRIEIRGNVGNVNILKVGNTRVAHFSVATNFAYKDRNGEPVIETTWHNVTAWEGNKGIPSLDGICKGFPIYVIGRLRTQKYVSGDGSEKTSYDVIANSVEPVESNVMPQMA